MGRIRGGIDEKLGAWMRSQPVFFVATAPLAGEGHLNCSPKGNRDELAVLGPLRIAYIDQTGSGIETVAHLAENSRIVVMFCAFQGPPRVVRVHGLGRAVKRGESEFEELAALFPRAAGVGARAIVVVDADRISDSCGYGVPFMTFEGHRETLDQWAERKGPDGIQAYWSEKNAASVDGLPGLGVS